MTTEYPAPQCEPEDPFTAVIPGSRLRFEDAYRHELFRAGVYIVGGRLHRDISTAGSADGLGRFPNTTLTDNPCLEELEKYAGIFNWEHYPGNDYHLLFEIPVTFRAIGATWELRADVEIDSVIAAVADGRIRAIAYELAKLYLWAICDTLHNGGTP
jgi:hypothetical protein